MNRPVVSDTTERWYAALPEYLRIADETEQSGGGYPLLRYLSLLGDQLDDVQTLYERINYLAPDEGGDVGDTSDLVNANTADASWLRWLSQLMGVDLSSAPTVVNQRDAIASVATGWQAGSKRALAAAAATALTGQRRVQIVDHYGGNPWVIGIRTEDSETPDVAAMLAAAATAKPAGFLLAHDSYATSWDQLEANLPGWDDGEALGSWTNIEELGTGSQMTAVYVSIKARFAALNDGRFVSDAAEIRSEEMGWALRMATMLGDKTQYALTENFITTKMERSNIAAATLTADGTTGWGTKLMASRLGNSAGVPTITNANWTAEADLDRCAAKIQAGRLFWRQQKDAAFSGEIQEAVDIGRQILQYCTVKVGNRRYLGHDPYQIGRTNGGLFPAGIMEARSSSFDFSAMQMLAEEDSDNFAEWNALIAGCAEMLSAATSTSGALATTARLIPDYFAWDLGTLSASPITVNTNGWTVTRSTNFGPDAMRCLQRLYWWWHWYNDPRALTLLRACVAFFKTDWAAHTDLVMQYSHAGVRTSAAVRTPWVLSVFLAAQASGEIAFADAVDAKLLHLPSGASLFVSDTTLGNYWSDYDNSDNRSTIEMYWSNFGFLADRGLLPLYSTKSVAIETPAETTPVAQGLLTALLRERL